MGLKSEIIKRSTLREKIKNYLAESILWGRYKPGDCIVETRIAKELKVSQGAVREAIRDLEQMGLVETKPYKGTYVRTFSLEDLKNVFIVRAELEGLAIGYALKKIRPEEINALENTFERMVAVAQKGKVEQYVKLDMAFHKTLVYASHNDILQRTWETVSLPYWTYFGVRQLGWELKRLALRHRAIIDALCRGNVENARGVMRRHFEEVKEFLDQKKS